MKLTMEDRDQCLTLINSNCIEGALFTFRGFGFLLFLEEEGPPRSLAGISLGDHDLSTVTPIFHATAFKSKLGKYHSHTLDIRW